MIEVGQARRKVLRHARALEPCRLPLAQAAGLVLAESVRADRDLPPFDRAAMDGYALRAAEVGRVKAFPVAAVISAGQAADVSVPPGHCVAIATGARSSPSRAIQPMSMCP